MLARMVQRRMVQSLGLAILLILAGSAAFAQQQLSVTAVRLGQHPDMTRFVMEINAEPAYRIFTLPDPYRVVIDLPQVDWRVPENQTKRRSVGVVDALRFGLFAPGTSRVVLDAEAPVVVKKAFVLPPKEGYPHRLVVDLQRVSRTAFLAEPNRRTITSKKPLPRPRTANKDVAPGRDDRRTIVIDAGHGGVDPGAIGVTGLYEKDLVLEYADDLKRALEQKGYRVIMTRDRDIFLRLRRRVALAQEAEGDLFISLHANTHPSNSIRGASVYTLSETASDAEAAALAEKENKADIIAGVDLNGQTEVVSQILIDLAQRESMNASKHFANMLVGELKGDVKLLNNTHRFAGFAVLKSPNVPSVLFEVGYMSNPEEIRLLQDEDHQRKVNRAVTRAVDRYFAWQEARNRS